jgi:hypothetical protein
MRSLLVLLIVSGPCLAADPIDWSAAYGAKVTVTVTARGTMKLCDTPAGKFWYVFDGEKWPLCLKCHPEYMLVNGPKGLATKIRCDCQPGGCGCPKPNGRCECQRPGVGAVSYVGETRAIVAPPVAFDVPTRAGPFEPWRRDRLDNVSERLDRRSARRAARDIEAILPP